MKIVAWPVTKNENVTAVALRNSIRLGGLSCLLVAQQSLGGGRGRSS